MTSDTGAERRAEADLTYHPVLKDASTFIELAAPIRLLVIGDDVPDAVTRAARARVMVDAGIRLPTGLYSFVESSGSSVLVVAEGSMPGPPATASWSDGDDNPLINAFGWFSAWWNEAVEIGPPSFAVGDDCVTVPSGQEATVRSRTFDAGTWWYEVRVEGRTVTVQETALKTPQLDDDPQVWIRRSPASAKRFAATLTRAKLRERLTDTVYSFRATRTLFRPYQFRPVMRLLAAGRLRLLIADEVGLGKTIEAGLVWTELDARNQANRVLVVCPSMLVPKWRAEMDERFGFDLRELNREALDELLAWVETDRVPRRYHAVCSLERLRVWGGLDRLAELNPQFDLIIVDEAHSFRNSGTRSHALGALLSDWADALVFLSATPLNLGNEDLYNLLELLAPGEFDDRFVLEQRLEPNAILNRIGSSLFDREVTNTTRRAWLRSIAGLAFGPAIVIRPEYQTVDDLLAEPILEPRAVAEIKRAIAQLHSLSAVVTRTRKVEVQDHKAVREAIPIDVAWTDVEYEFYREFDHWQRDRALKRGLPVGFVTQMPLRLASTCVPAARDRVLTWDAAVWAEDDLEAEDETVDEPDIPPPLSLVQLAHDVGDVDTKFDSFLEMLEPIVAARKRVLVFTFSRAALAYLERRLQEPFRVRVLHGDIAKEERHDTMRRFRDHEFDVLLASRVASEGLDFEFCSAVVNYDLPWNPMEVEQRIGRIDRFGQTEDKVLILNFHTPGTIETDIIERVHQRIGVFTDSIGELEPILQSKMAELRRAIFDFELDEEQRARRLDETLAAIEEQRMTRADVEDATAYLSSTDDAEIDGLETDLTTHGRYVGQSELVHLLDDWALTAGARATTSTRDGMRISLRGNEQMADHLRGVQAAGERSAAEIDQLVRVLRDDGEVWLCLDQELARTTGETLLAANHPLTRAALRVPGDKQARFARVSYQRAGVQPGTYFVLVAIARWTGLRPAQELWTAAVELPSGLDADEAIGAGVLASLAEGAIASTSTNVTVDPDFLLPRVQRQLRRRQADEERRRSAENESLSETRKISLRETHVRKVEQIQRRIRTLQAGGKTTVIHLQEAQLRNQERLLSESEGRLAAGSVGAMDVEAIAACVVEVLP